MNVENSVESVERFAFLPQDIGSFSPFCSVFSPYFGVLPINEYEQHLRETVSDIIKNVKA